MRNFLLTLTASLLAGLTVSAQNKADIESSSPRSSYSTTTTANGWVIANAQFVSIDGVCAPTLNGRTSSVGSITSPTLNNGIGSISFKYANTFSETQGVKLKIDIIQNYETAISDTLINTSVEKGEIYTFTSKEFKIAGDFIIQITNLSPSNISGSNKDRVSIWNLTWTNYTWEKRDADISFSEKEYSASLFGANTFPTLINPNNLAISYNSSNESIASIDDEGNISILAEGETTISATSAANDYFFAGEASYILTVSDTRRQADISFSETEYSASLFGANTFPTLINPNNLAISYNSSDESIASIDDEGNISILAEGETTISATSAADDYFFAGEASYILTVSDTRRQADISFSETEYSANLFGDNTFPLLANPNGLLIAYSSSNESVATVDADGNISLLAEGETTISATSEANNEFFAGETSYILTVTDTREYAEISFPDEEYSANLKDKFESPVLVNPFNLAITYESSNENVATVDAQGRVTIVGEGITVISATSKETNIYKSTKAEYTLSVINTTLTLNDPSFYNIVNGYAEVKRDERYKVLTDVVIPENVIIDGVTYMVGSIGIGAFNGCQALMSVQLPSNLQEIGQNAFWRCSSLQHIDIPQNVLRIYDGAFAYCTSLTTIKFPDGLNSIRRGVISSEKANSPILNCSGLTEVILPNNKYNLEDYIAWHYTNTSFFKGCTSLKEISIPDNVDGLSDGFFAENTSIEKIKIGKSFARFPSSINDLPNLNDVEIDSENSYFKLDGKSIYLQLPSSTTKFALVRFPEVPADGILRLLENTIGIQGGTLKGKTLKEVIFPRNITEIGCEDQLVGCDVGKLVIPANINYIGLRAFRCSNIDTLIIEAAPTQLVMDALDSRYQNDSPFCEARIKNVIINRDIDNINNYLWPKTYTKAFYRSSIGTIEVNASLGEKACGIFSNASVSKIIIGPEVETLYALGCRPDYDMEIHSLDKLEAPFFVDDGPLNKYSQHWSTYTGFRPKNLYVYPSALDYYKAELEPYYVGIYPLPGTAAIQFNQVSKTVRPGQEFVIEYTTHPENFSIDWISSNPAVVSASEDGVLTAHKNGVAIITASGRDKGYTDAKTSMTVYVSDSALIEANEAHLTLTGLGNHASRHTYKAGSNAVIDILPDDEWQIHSVTLNGEDITAEVVGNSITTPKLFGENQMNVVLKQDGITEINTVTSPSGDINIRCTDNAVSVYGLEENETIRIYSINGENVYTGSKKTITLHRGQVYLLKARATTFKFIL